MICRQFPLIELARGGLDGQEQQRLVDHLKECRECRERFHVVRILRAHFSPRQRRRSPGGRLLPLAAAVLLAAAGLTWLTTLSRQGESAPRLASLRKHPYFPSRVRGREDSAEQRAYLAYSQNRFRDAARLLDLLPGEARHHLFRGVSLYLSGQPALALDVLERIAPGEGQWYPAALWFRAQAHLKMDQPGHARLLLQRLLAGPAGRYTERARFQLAQLRKGAP